MRSHSIKDAQQFKEERFTKITIVKNQHSIFIKFPTRPRNEATQSSWTLIYLCELEGSGVSSIDGEAVRVGKGDVI